MHKDNISGSKELIINNYKPVICTVHDHANTKMRHGQHKKDERINKCADK